MSFSVDGLAGACGRNVRRYSFFVSFLWLMGCGARTGLLQSDHSGVWGEPGGIGGGSAGTAGVAGAAGVGGGGGQGNLPTPQCQGAPNGSASVDIGPLTLQVFGGIASSGCTFGATWIANESGGLVVKACTFEADQGQWVASQPVSVLNTGVESSKTDIVWDGMNYVIGWTSQGRLHSQKMNTKGQLVGGVVDSLLVADNAYLCWMHRSQSENTIRVGMLGDSVEQFHYLIYYGAITLDGTSSLDLLPVSKNVTDAELVGITEMADGSNLVVWIDRAGVTLMVSQIDSAGNDLSPPKALMTTESIQTSRYGVTRNGDDVYFGVWSYDSNNSSVLLGQLTDSGYNVVTTLPSQDRPILATTENGAVGALLVSEAFTGQQPMLTLQGIESNMISWTATISENEGQAYSYGMAAGAESFGILWGSSNSLRFVTYTP